MVKKRKVKVGIIGCGAIGSRLAKSIKKELGQVCVLSGLYDIHFDKSNGLARQLSLKKAFKKTLTDLIKGSDLVVEAVNAEDTEKIILQAIKAKKNVLAMSVGKLLNSTKLFSLARKNKCNVLIPSGAIAGIDAIKAASLVKIFNIILTTRKPISGFEKNSFSQDKGINFDDIKSETVIFDGDVDTAVKLFPRNINVAATIALASGAKDKMSIRIVTSPEFKTNSHEIEVNGEFGRITTRTDNEVCPDNPKTSYLAVLSAIQTLKQFFSEVKIGT